MPLIITGMQEARSTIAAYQAAAHDHGSTKGWAVHAAAPYAGGIEEGRRKNGRLARRAGGLHFMARAVNEATTSGRVQDTLNRGVTDKPAALRGLRQRLANDIANIARRQLQPFPYSPSTRVHSGRLAASIQVVRAGEGLTLVVPIIRATPRPRHSTGRRRP